MGSLGGENWQQGGGWRTRQGRGWWTGQGSSWQSGQSHISMWINSEEQLGIETDCATQGSTAGK